MNVGWILFSIIYVIVWAITMVMLVKKRSHSFIRFRNFPLLFAQCVGLLIATSLSAWSMALRPHFNCYVTYFGTLMAFASFAAPFALRCFEYGVNFHIAKTRTKFREGEKFTTESNDWFVHNRWCANKNILLGIYLIGFFLWMIPLIPYIHYSDSGYDYSPETGGCVNVKKSDHVIMYIFIFFIVVALLLAALMYGSKDVYHVKEELNAMAITWVIVFVILTPYTLFAPDHVMAKLSSAFWPLLGFCFSLVENAMFPLYLCHKYHTSETKPQDVSDSYKQYLSQLEDMQFRNKFHEFLANQFCEENLLFYEVATEWKHNPRASQTLFIVNNFIGEKAICQININSEQVEAIQNGVLQESVPTTIFDDAIAAVISMMYANSYVLFNWQEKNRRQTLA